MKKQKNKMYCINCKHFRDIYTEGNPYAPLENCLNDKVNKKDGDNWKSHYTIRLYPYQINGKNDCEGYEEKNQEDKN